MWVAAIVPSDPASSSTSPVALRIPVAADQRIADLKQSIQQRLGAQLQCSVVVSRLQDEKGCVLCDDDLVSEVLEHKETVVVQLENPLNSSALPEEAEATAASSCEPSAETAGVAAPPTSIPDEPVTSASIPNTSNPKDAMKCFVVCRGLMAEISVETTADAPFDAFEAAAVSAARRVLDMPAPISTVWFGTQSMVVPAQSSVTLEQLGIRMDGMLWMIPRAPLPDSSPLGSSWSDQFYNHPSWQPTVLQSDASLAMFLCSLYVVVDFLAEDEELAKKTLGHLRRLCDGFGAPSLALYYLIQRNPIGVHLRAALAEGFLFLTKRLVPTTDRSGANNDLFLHSRQVWAFLLADWKAKDAATEVFEEVAYHNLLDAVNEELKAGTMTVTAKLDSTPVKTFPVNLRPGASVAELKHKLSWLTGVNKESQSLVWDGGSLEEGSTLDEEFSGKTILLRNTGAAVPEGIESQVFSRLHPVWVRQPDSSQTMCGPYSRWYIEAVIQRGGRVPGLDFDVELTMLEADAQLEARCLCFPLGPFQPMYIWCGSVPNPAISTDLLPLDTAQLPARLLAFPKLQVVPSLSLRQGAYPCLTWSAQGTMCVFVGRSKSVGADCQLLDPVGKEIHEVDPTALAVQTSGYSQGSGEGLADLRPHEEAIVVLLDISGSMRWCWNEGREGNAHAQPPSYRTGDQVEVNFWCGIWAFAQVLAVYPTGRLDVKMQDGRVLKGIAKETVRPLSCMSRLDVVRRLMDAFSNRSRAYDYPHAIGLTTFSGSIKVVVKLTRLFENFEQHLGKCTAEGGTALYDALESGYKQLMEFRQGSAGVTCRILCLTDGDDTSSDRTAMDVVSKLQAADIIVDSVLIGGANNRALRGISVATGGYCFRPTTIADAVRLFERETMLSARQREPSTCPKQPLVCSESAFLRLQDEVKFPLTLQPTRKHVVQLDRPVLAPEAVLAKYMVNAPPPSATSSKTVQQVRLLLRELMSLQRDPHPAVRVYPLESDVTFWRLILVAPETTPYEGGTFLLFAQFGEGYPQKAPEVRFITPIYHCNINADGKVCHSVLDRNWTATTKFRQVIDCIYGLLLTPEPHDPLDSTLAETYFADKLAYERKAREMTLAHAAQSLQAWEEKLLLKEGSVVPESFLCPLTHAVFQDPVTAPSGNTYERVAIVEWIRSKGTDPMTRAPLTEAQLVPNLVVKNTCATMKPWWE